MYRKNSAPALKRSCERSELRIERKGDMLEKHTWRWTGFRGEPGFTNFYFLAGDSTSRDTASAKVRTFFDAIKGVLPTNVTVQPNAEVNHYNEATGVLTDVLPIDDLPTPVVGTGGSSYSAASGAVIHWLTVGVVGNRLLRGRTFIVPTTDGVYDAQGDLSTVSLATLRNAATAFHTGLTNKPYVWSRPTSTRAGVAHPITSSRVPDMGAILRSRRD